MLTFSLPHTSLDSMPQQAHATGPQGGGMKPLTLLGNLLTQRDPTMAHKVPRSQKQGASPSTQTPQAVITTTAAGAKRSGGTPGGQGDESRGAQAAGQASSQGSQCAVNKGAISQLQEFVQGAKLYPMPPNCPVLQWGYDSRMVGKDSLEFRATVAFMLDGVPHHAAGSWKHNKVLAKRDAAERTLGLFVNRWGGVAVQDFELWNNPPSVQEEQPLAPKDDCDSSPPPEVGVNREERELQNYCETSLSEFAAMPTWTHTWSGDSCQAFAEIRIFGVPHTFPGKPCATREAAYRDAARRALWYLQCPGYEDLYEPDPEFVKAAAHMIPEASASWSRDGCAEEGEEQLLAERKTLVMRVQNRLQQAFAQQLKVGTSVWFWSYERHPRDKEWPPLYCATVHVPLAGRTFVGTWTRGQREAQIDACSKIAEFLDAEFPRTKGS
mmetsp:Transcript_111225/g.321577  ORF Transcript_111225/g.321577 Transcript_111225/m.321577 type:complete len:439 (-) Transcript_111225:188-1504(-)